MRIRPAVLILLLFAAPAALAQDARTEFGLVRASLLESVIGQMFSGATLEWGSTPMLVQGTTHRPIRVVAVDYRPDDGGGYTGVTSVEFLEDRSAIATAIQKFEAPATRSPAEIAVFKANAQFAVTELRRGNLNDPASLIESVDDLELSTLTYDQPWPDIFVTYTATYGTADFHGQVRWDEELVADPAVAAKGRAPALLWREEKKGGTLRSDQADANVVDEHTLSFSSHETKQVVSNCADPCLPDGRVLLALWWTTATATATP